MTAGAGALEGKSARLTRSKFDWEFWLVGLMSLAVFCYMAYVLIFQIDCFLTDAMARTRSAMQVFFSSEPKLENIGFVWAPLPALLQLPFVLIPALRYKGLSGNLVTALCAAGSVQVMLLFLRQTRLPAIPRWLILAVYILNPVILFYASNGMSEMVLILFAMLTAYTFLRWHQTQHWKYLTACGITTSLAFLSRYDASFMAVAVTVFIVIEGLLIRRKGFAYTESIVWLYDTPVAYTIGLWVLFNWVIMKDPLYFMHSDYSNAGQIGYQLAMIPDLLPLKQNLLASLGVGLRETTLLFPAGMIATLWLFVMAIYRRKWVWLAVAALGWSLTLFSIFNLYLGQSALFLRYFIAAIPIGVVLMIGVISMYSPRMQIPVALLLVVLGLGSAYFTTLSMKSHTEWGQWNDRVLNAVITGKPLHTWMEERDLADYIVKKTTGYVLVDDFQGYRVLFFSGRPWRFITPSDSVFKSDLRDPYKNVNYILSSSSDLEGELNQINNMYPTLYAVGGAWVKLEYQNSTWKLYQVTSNPDKLNVDSLLDRSKPPGN